MDFAFQTIDFIQATASLLDRHALHANSETNFSLSALNRMRDVANGH